MHPPGKHLHCSSTPSKAGRARHCACADQAMNRSLANVILGGYGTSASTAKAVEGTHTETDLAAVVETLTQVGLVALPPLPDASNPAGQREQLMPAPRLQSMLACHEVSRCGWDSFCLPAHSSAQPWVFVCDSQLCVWWRLSCHSFARLVIVLDCATVLTPWTMDTSFRGPEVVCMMSITYLTPLLSRGCLV